MLKIEVKEQGNECIVDYKQEKTNDVEHITAIAHLLSCMTLNAEPKNRRKYLKTMYKNLDRIVYDFIDRIERGEK